MHAVVALAHTVTAADDAELDGGAAGTVDAVLHPLCHLPQVVVAGHALAPGVGDADHGTLEVLGGKAHGLERGAVILIAQSFQNVFAAFH